MISRLNHRAYLKAMGCLNPGGHRGFSLSFTAQHTLTFSSPEVSRIPASGREGCGSPPEYKSLHIINELDTGDEKFTKYTQTLNMCLMQLTTANCSVVVGGDLVRGELVGLWSGWSLAGLLGVREGNIDLREESGREETGFVHL